jgi:transcriptional regulator with XRE-family HTH domain
MDFGKRIIELRKTKGISQTELASQLGIHKNVLGRYEREEAKPSIEVAKNIADLLEVSLDYLTGKIDTEVDKEIVDKVLTIQNLPEDERNRILFTIDALVRDAKSRFAYAS